MLNARSMPFSGITSALITPFSNTKLDKASFLKLLHLQVHKGIRQFVLASTTGENPTLEDSEVEQLCRWLKEFEKEHLVSLKLILAPGSFSTKQAIEKTKKAIDWGAHGLLVVTPYYNRPPQKGLILHFEKIAKVAGSLPLIVYNVPSRTACSLTVESIKTLSQVDNIIGIKEASGDMEFLKRIQANVAKDFLLLSGDDLSCVEFFNLGGHGAISAAANILAGELLNLFNSSPAQRTEKFNKYKNFLEELFQQTNPIGIKQILHETEVIASPELRLPMVFIKNPNLCLPFKN